MLDHINRTPCISVFFCDFRLGESNNVTGLKNEHVHQSSAVSDDSELDCCERPDDVLEIIPSNSFAGLRVTGKTGDDQRCGAPPRGSFSATSKKTTIEGLVEMYHKVGISYIAVKYLLPLSTIHRRHLFRYYEKVVEEKADKDLEDEVEILPNGTTEANRGGINDVCKPYKQELHPEKNGTTEANRESDLINICCIMKVSFILMASPEKTLNIIAPNISITNLLSVCQICGTPLCKKHFLDIKGITRNKSIGNDKTIPK
ncbi:hypothetical protein QE152_g27666 [Popillia japonica]|uniref:Uncharacterized protein n=1 Tax=Popillia japonica TaxID=7064 RepID=A0AAW1JT35_POPJA